MRYSVGPVGKDALPALRKAGEDSNWNNRVFAFSAIASIGPEPEDIPMLIRALGDKQRNVRIQAARGLGNLEAQSKEAIGALRNALRDEDESVRKFAASALTKIDLKAAADNGNPNPILRP
jgi:HEAT repeat protein